MRAVFTVLLFTVVVSATSLQHDAQAVGASAKTGQLLAGGKKRGRVFKFKQARMLLQYSSILMKSMMTNC